MTVGLRAGDLTLSRSKEPNAWQGTVYSVLPAGSEWYVKVRCGRHDLTVRVYDDLNLNIDSRAVSTSFHVGSWNVGERAMWGLGAKWTRRRRSFSL